MRRKAQGPSAREGRAKASAKIGALASTIILGRSAAAETEELSALIGDAYDASLDPELWPSVLEKVGAFARASMVNLFSQDVVNHHANRLFTWDGDPHHHKLYLEKYAALNPLFPKGLFFPVGEVLVMTDIISYAAYRKSRFYKEWAGPQGFIDFAGVIIEKVATSLAALAVVRGEREGLVDDEMVRRMKLITPHIRRALLISKVILNKLQTATFAETHRPPRLRRVSRR
jgi:hypothetical protein